MRDVSHPLTRVNPPLTAERARELLSYDPERGVLTRQVATSNRVRQGDVAGNLSVHGYLQVCVDGRMYRAHRLIWLIAYGEWPGAEIDHINGIKTDNRLANLRVVTSSENGQNQRRAQVRNRLGLLGVTRHRERFAARIGINGRSVHLGLFSTPEEAHAAYLDAKRRLHPAGTI